MKKSIKITVLLIAVILVISSCMPAAGTVVPSHDNSEPVNSANPGETTDPGKDKDRDPVDLITWNEQGYAGYIDENHHIYMPEPVAVGSMDAVSYYDFADPQKWEKFNNYVFSDLSPFDEPKVTATESGSVTELPIFADFLQYTGYSVFLLFGVDGGLIGIQTEKAGYDPALVTSETVNKDAELTVSGGQTVKINTGTSASRCRVFAEWAEDNGNAFIPVAARLSSAVPGTLEIIGKLGENGRLVIAEKDRIDVSGIELEYVPAVYSLSEAAVAYKQYVEKRLSFAKNDLFLIPWKSELLAGRSAYSKLTSDVFEAGSKADVIYKMHSDEVIAIPLAGSYSSMGNQGWEGECMLFISFKNGQPIGETVLEFYHPWATVGLSDHVYYKDQYAGLKYEHLGEKTGDGYAPLGSIGYVSFVKSLGDLSKVAGIYADASGYHAIMK